MTSILRSKNILVTGGTGSIGEELAQKALSSGAKSIKVFSNDENGLYEMERKLGNNKLEFIIGDIRNEERVRYAVEGTEIVFHTAALKHVDRCELNPMEAITVNILGTKNVILAALKEKVEKVISISTDKAVNPIGVMGATKLLAEKLIVAEAFRNNSTVFASVRFGNVLQSRGSVLLQIEDQIKKGQPVTLTDERMIRFFMTKEQAVNLIISATELAKGGETFVLKMPVVRLRDLFDVMKQILAPRYGYKPSQIKTKITGIRAGEKLIEDLLSEYEIEHVTETKDFYIIPPSLQVGKKMKPSFKSAKERPAFDFIQRDQVEKMMRKIYHVNEHKHVPRIIEDPFAKINPVICIDCNERLN